MVRSLPTGVGTPKPPHAVFSEIGDKVIAHVRFSNRPFGVKRFQTIHHHSVDVARGLVLLFGIGTKALPSWDSRTGGTIFRAALPPIERQVQADMRTQLIHRPPRHIFHRSVEIDASSLIRRLRSTASSP